MTLLWGLERRKRLHTWVLVARTWLWREVAKGGLKEAGKLLKVTGSHPVLEAYCATRSATGLQCAKL